MRKLSSVFSDLGSDDKERCTDEKTAHVAFSGAYCRWRYFHGTGGIRFFLEIL